MAKYSVTHICGCTVAHDLYGWAEEREAQKAKIASRDCPDCYRKKQAEKAAEESREMGL